MKKAVFKINGMHCASCAMDIDFELEDNGVKSAKTSYAKSKTEVEFDEKKMSEDDITKIIRKTGYDANPD